MLVGRRRGAWRWTAISLLLASSAVALVFRLAQLQIVQHQEYRLKAKEEHWDQQLIWGHRGTIRDRQGYPLATTVTVYNVFLDPEVGPESLTATAEALAASLNLSPQDILAKATEAKEPLLVQAKVPYDIGNKITRKELPGVRLEKQTQRVYPEGNLAASLLGFVGRDNGGLTGIEADFNQELSGIAGNLIFERDSVGNPIPVGYRQLSPPQDGADVILTIDRFAQRLAEKKLDEAIAKNKASSGTIIVMEPQTGAILAMASRPTFNLERLNLADEKQMTLYRNRAITDMYEPGSVFKTVTLAAALNEKLVTPQTTFFDRGPLVKSGWRIDTWDGQHHGTESMTQLLVNSCNVGAAWVSDLLGPDRFYKYVARFGFGQPTNIGLSGESPGQVRTSADRQWRPVDIATNSFGQGINVTPLQMITAIAAVANGGKLMQPMIIKEIRGEKSQRVFQPKVVREVITPETSRLLKGMLKAVVEEGAAKTAMVPGYTVAGKTGTASIPATTGYNTTNLIASFAGFVPLEDPKLVILVRIDNPQGTPWGSQVAAPVFQAIAQQLLPDLSIPPEPNLVGKRD